MIKKNKSNFVITFSVALTLLFSSCQPEEITTSEPLNSISTENPELNQLQESNGILTTISWRGEQIDVYQLDGKYFMGDLYFVPDEESGYVASKGTGRNDKLWSNNTVYYTINSALPNQYRVNDAITYWENNTNITFVQRTNQTDYIEFTTGTGCASYVGRIGGKQEIYLANACSTGNTMHEIGHAVGLFHEQSRTDRDNWITVNYGNITSGYESAFDKWTTSAGLNLTSSLDFYSIMMYDSYAFSKNGLPTMVKNDGSTFTRQRSYLSTADLQGIAILYPPLTNLPTTVTFLANNGKYLSSENGVGDLTVNRLIPYSWETFELIDEGNGKYSIKGNNNRYISSENGKKPMTCNRVTPGSWAKFTLEKKSGNQYYIKGNNGKYVSSNNGDTTLGIVCDRVTPLSWETFTINGL